jgi:F0F1-type ATP synthase assembly protein I
MIGWRAMASDPLDNKKKDDSGLTPAQQKAAGFSRQFAVAMELPFVIVASALVGGLLGFFLDRWLHSKPYLMMLFGLLGFFGGVRDVLRRVGQS